MIRNPSWLLWGGGGIAWVAVALSTLADNGPLQVSGPVQAVAETRHIVEQCDDVLLSLEEDTNFSTSVPDHRIPPVIQSADVSGDSCIPVNTAGIDALTTLPGIGPVLAERIISFRQEQGRFSCAADLIKVKGIGEAKLKKITGRICF
jgi:competence ComEA-like helix-hairpin-helix protein